MLSILPIQWDQEEQCKVHTIYNAMYTQQMKLHEYNSHRNLTRSLQQSRFITHGGET